MLCRWFPVCVLLWVGLFVLGLPTGHAQAVKKRGFALLVGVSEYDHADLDTLQYTEKDVEALARLLDQPGSPFRGNVRLLTGTRGKDNKADLPTTANINLELKKLIKDRTRGDMVLVALSGHGVQLKVRDPKGNDEDRSYGFFCPKDAQLIGTNYLTGRNPRLILLSELFEDLGDCGAGTKLVLMDACRNELKARTRTVRVARDLVPEGVDALFSCKPGEVAYEAEKLEHGLFFYYVLQGLRGEAKNGRGEVTWTRLADYVTEKVSDEAPALLAGARQTPHRVMNAAGKSPVLLALGGEEMKPKVEKVVKKAPEKVIQKEPEKVIQKEPEKVVKKSPEKVGKVSGQEVVNSIGMKLVRIPRGKFWMGSARDEANRYADEFPHEVEITKDIWLGVYEVTQEQYEKVMGTNPSWFSPVGGGKGSVKGLDTSGFPVEQVSWQDAQDFCAALSARPAEKKAGRRYRLPTEAEWEYACRGGTSSPYHFGNALSSSQANFNNNLGRPCKCGSYRPNGYGLYDMHGNVWEWCHDWYDPNYYRASPRRDPHGPAATDWRVNRSGCWDRQGWECRSASRHGNPPTTQMIRLGFRAALVPAR